MFIKEWFNSIDKSQIIALIVGIIAIVIAIKTARTVMKDVLFVVSALAALYFFVPSLYVTVYGWIVAAGEWVISLL